MTSRSKRLVATGSFSLALALGSVLPFSGPAAASCIPLDTMLPDAATPGALVFVGTVTGTDQARTQLIVDAWYLGDGPTHLVVEGGRQPGTITSADWVPGPGERFVVVAERTAEGGLITGTCEQSLVFAPLLGVLQTRYGAPQLPPFVPSPSGSPEAIGSPVASASPVPPIITSGASPGPGSLVHASPTPLAGTPARRPPWPAGRRAEAVVLPALIFALVALDAGGRMCQPCDQGIRPAGAGLGGRD